MYECEYSREPVDSRLLWLRFIRKIWLFIVCAALGALLVGSIHSIKRLIISGGRSYQAETLYYVEYDCKLENLSTSPYNFYTWGEIGRSDAIIDALYDKMSGSITKEELKNAVLLTCDSDVRYIYARVTMHEKNLSLEVANKLEPIFIDYVLGKAEFSDAYVVTKASMEKDVTNYRIKNALILGAFIGFFAAVILWFMYALTDTSVYVPATIEKRYHIPTLTAPSMREFDTNCKSILSPKETVGLYAIEGETTLSDVFSKYVNVETITDDLFLMWAREKHYDVVIELKAANHNGKKLERALEELARLSINVCAIVLVSEDSKLINSYYRR